MQLAERSSKTAPPQDKWQNTKRDILPPWLLSYWSASLIVTHPLVLQFHSPHIALCFFSSLDSRHWKETTFLFFFFGHSYFGLKIWAKMIINNNVIISSSPSNDVHLFSAETQWSSQKVKCSVAEFQLSSGFNFLIVHPTSSIFYLLSSIFNRSNKHNQRKLSLPNAVTIIPYLTTTISDHPQFGNHPDIHIHHNSCEPNTESSSSSCLCFNFLPHSFSLFSRKLSFCSSNQQKLNLIKARIEGRSERDLRFKRAT